MTYPAVATAQLPATELDAVNLMLSSIGEAPVASLTGTLPTDVTFAQATLYQILLEVLTIGWYFNTYNNYKITADGSGFLNLPTNTLRAYADPSNPTYRDIVQKGSKFWDRYNQTYVFAAGTVVYAEIVELIDYVDLPAYARYYIAVRAARIFADRVMGSGSTHGFNNELEARALAIMKQSDFAAGQYSMFDNESVFRVVNRDIVNALTF